MTRTGFKQRVAKLLREIANKLDATSKSATPAEAIRLLSTMELQAAAQRVLEKYGATPTGIKASPEWQDLHAALCNVRN